MAVTSRDSYYAYRAAAGVARGLPLPIAETMANAAGLGMTRAMQGRRDMVERHLKRIHGPDLKGLRLEHEVRRAFASYARYWMESFRLPDTSAAELDAHMSWEGVGHLEAAYRRGKGMIMALPHLGGWDFAGAWLCSVGYPITVVVESVEPPELFEWFRDLRAGMGMTIVPLGPKAGTAILAALRANTLVGLVSDRDLEGNGVEVDFFGERTTLPAGAATLALRTGASILPTTVYFKPRNQHLGVIGPPLAVQRQGSLRDDVARVTQDLARELEALIRRAPEQWHVFQPLWPSDPGYHGPLLSPSSPAPDSPATSARGGGSAPE